MTDASALQDSKSGFAPPEIARLKKRAEFLACAKAPSCARGAVVVQALERSGDGPLIRAGFTATRKIGGAVVRNRAKRRLREVARLILPLHGRPAHDYVFIARGGTADRPWPRLLDDVKSALISLAANPAPAARSRKPAAPSSTPQSSGSHG